MRTMHDLENETDSWVGIGIAGEENWRVGPDTGGSQEDQSIAVGAGELYRLGLDLATLHPVCLRRLKLTGISHI